MSWKQPRREHGTFSRDAALKVTGVSSAGLCGDGDSPGGRRCLPLSLSLGCCHVLRSGHSQNQRSAVKTAVRAQRIFYSDITVLSEQPQKGARTFSGHENQCSEAATTARLFDHGASALKMTCVVMFLYLKL